MTLNATIERPAKQGIIEMFIPVLRKLTLAGAAALALGTLGIALLPAAAYADGTVSPDTSGTTKAIKLGLNKSLVIDLPRDARDLLVSNPDIADAVIRTPRRIYLTGIKVGQANIIVFDRAGTQIVTLDLSVERDGIDLNALLRRLLPDSDINVEVMNDNIILTGTVKNADDSSKAQDVAQAFIGGAGSGPASNTSGTPGNGTTPDANAVTVAVSNTTNGAASNTSGPRVINLLSIDGEDQVHLKVTVAEVERNVAKQLGIDLSGAGGSSGFVSSILTSNPFPVSNKAPSDSVTAGYFKNEANALIGTLQALDQTGMVRTLAEPTLTAISGESASFLAGGEFPVPTAFDATTHQITVTFKQFGVALSFTPVVLSAGRISLHVKTEDSELSNEGAVSLGTNISIPSLKVRRAETTVELPSGGSMVLGGLLQDNIAQSISGFPGLKNIPILGTLFRSRDFLRNETELVIFVTPYLVKPVSETAIARPDDGFAPADDDNSNFLGRLNRVYGAKGAPAPAGAYRGTYGFIFE